MIGYVPQLISTDATLSGYETLLIFAKLYGIPRTKRNSIVQAALGSWAFPTLRTSWCADIRVG